jgi:hypothetical protein
MCEKCCKNQWAPYDHSMARLRVADGEDGLQVWRIAVNILSCARVTVDGVFALVIGFIEHSQIITTSNYSAIANSYTLQFTTACTKPSQPVVFTSLCLVAASNAIDPSTSMSMASSPCWVSLQLLS